MKKTILVITAASVLFIGPGLAAQGSEKPKILVKAPARGTRAYFAMEKNYAAVIEPLFRVKCMDCHSSTPHYPWYYKMPLIKSLIDRDIRNARKLLDLSDGFPFSGMGNLSDHLTGLNTVATDNSMPPMNYKLAHLSSRLSRAERALIIAWTTGQLPAPGARTPPAKK